MTNKGVVLPLTISLAVIFGTMLFIILSIVSSIDEVESKIDVEIIEPSLADLKTNVLFSTIPNGRSDMFIDVLSGYITSCESTCDISYRESIEDTLTAFSESRTEIIFDGGMIDNGIEESENFEAVLRNITVYNKIEEISVVYYE